MAITDEARTATGRAVPFAMRGPLHVPRERYYDREFFDLEKEHLWPRVWQVACRLEEIPEPGDFVEYEICDDSVLVIRQPDRSVKAFHNACRHRATQLCKGAGRLRGGQIVCPFHGWRWNLDGTNSFVYNPEGFAPECLQADDLRLQECLVDTWGACVWINMDLSARPLREALSPVFPLLDAVGVEDMRVWWWKETVVNANWKMAQEAFHEGYHVMATHPQLTYGLGEDYPSNNTEYTAFENGHARFQSRSDPSQGGVAKGRGPDGFLDRSRTLWEGQDAMTLERDLQVFEGMRNKVPPGEDFPTAAIKALFDYAEGAGIPLRTGPEGMRLWGGEIFLFPNFFFLPQYENALSYRVRPYNDDPDWCRFEVWSLTMYPEGQEPGRATLQGRYDTDDAQNWGLIPRQDFSNMVRQQRGVHSRGFRESRLATEMEQAISNMHMELDRYLSRYDDDVGHERGPVVHVEPIGIDLELLPGETIIEAAWRYGYHWPTVCYGQAECTACHVEVQSGAEHLTPVEDEEREALEQRLPGARRRDLTRIRLACRAQATGDVTVHKAGVRPLR